MLNNKWVLTLVMKEENDDERDDEGALESLRETLRKLWEALQSLVR